MMQGMTLGAYRIESELGSGGMGKVYLAEAIVRCAVPAGTRVALKVVHPHLLSEPGFFKRFLREADIGKAVTHPNVVCCYDCDQLVVDGTTHAFLVMEYVEGQTLRDLLVELETVPEELCRHIGREVAKGLAAIHEAGVVHRDLKPENVLITPDHQVKVMDLGVARLKDEAIRLSMSGAFVGSVLYASPEQFQGMEADGRADLFSLGVILYELACGVRPHAGDNFASVLARVVEEKPRRLGDRNPQLSAFFEEVVHALLAKDREDRFASGSKLLEVLTQGENSTWWGRRAKALRAETTRPIRRIRIPRETAVYGREEEFDKLTTLYERAKDGDGQVVLIEGEAGIGKTRLIDEMVGRLQQYGEDLNFLFGSYPPGGAATASGAWSTAYREQFGAVGLEETLGLYLETAPILVPAFAALLRGEPPPAGQEVLTKDSIQTVFVHSTRALAKERTTVVLIEDLHFAPEEGLALFAALSFAVSAHRILLVGTARPGLSEEWRANLERLPVSSRLELQRLGPKDLAGMLKEAFESEILAAELSLKVAEKSDGNPFFVFEIIRGLREGQFITRRPDGTWVTTKVIKNIEIPSSVQDLIRVRIADLDEREQELLDVAACCGFEFDPGLVAEALGKDRIPALRMMGHLEKAHRLIRSCGRNFVFDHHQFREVLYAGISPQLREEYHAAISDVLEARHREPTGAVAVTLCEHLLQGTRCERALPHLAEALDHLEAGFQNDQAVALADRALAEAGLLAGEPRLPVLLRKAGRLDLLGRTEEEKTAIREAIELGEALGLHAPLTEARIALGRVCLRAVEPEAARAVLKTAVDLAREIGNRALECDALSHLASAYSHLGESEHSVEVARQALALAVESGDMRAEARVRHSLAVILSRLVRFDREGATHAEQALALAHKAGDRRLEANALVTLAVTRGNMGDHRRALTALEQSLLLLEEIGDRPGMARALPNLCHALLEADRIREARARIGECIELARDIGDRWHESYARRILGSILFKEGRYSEARDQHLNRIAFLREIGDRFSECRGLVQLANALLGMGHLRESKDACEQALMAGRDAGDEIGNVFALLTLSWVLLDLGRDDRAFECVERVQELVEDLKANDMRPYLLYARGEVEERQGDSEAARGSFESALEEMDPGSQPEHEADCYLGLGRVARAEGRLDAARESLSTAVRIAEEASLSAPALRAKCEAALLPGGDPEEAAAMIREVGSQLMAGHGIASLHLIFLATGDPGHLKEAHRLLCDLRDHAPEEYRETMIENVPLRRDIMTAWKEHARAK